MNKYSHGAGDNLLKKIKDSNPTKKEAAPLVGYTAIMWAWHDYRTNSYHHVYDTEHQVKLCSPDKFKIATENGDGRITMVSIKAV